MTIVAHARTWWGALIRPASAPPLILKPKFDGFDAFLLGLIALLYGLYGVSMGLFAGFLPALISAIKLPLLFVLSLAICAPPFYVLNCLYGPRIRPHATARLLLVAASANAVAVCSYAPISYFFVFTTETSGYVFLVAMHVGVLAVAGVASIGVNLVIIRATASHARGSLPAWMIAAWAVVYAGVGSHLSWVLRPWVGSPDKPYTLFRPIEGSFIESVIAQFQALF